MAKIRLTKEFHYEMSHVLWNYEGLCSNIHGHSYTLFVTIVGEPIKDKNNPKLGMVIDFGDLKKIVKEVIIDMLDHAFVVSKDAPTDLLKQVPQMFHKMVVVDYQPTCENMIIDFASRIEKKLPKYVRLFSLKLHETPTSFAEWYADDNK